MPASKDDLRKLARGRMSNRQDSNLKGRSFGPDKGSSIEHRPTISFPISSVTVRATQEHDGLMRRTPGHDVADVHLHVMTYLIFIWVDI